MSETIKLKRVENFYTQAESLAIYQHFLSEHHWPDNSYQFAGRQFVLPRLQTWHADQGIRYRYSNNLLATRPWTTELSDIRQKVETFLNHAFNAVLVNCYRDGHDYVGWHADDEPELGEQAVIASLSFGAARYFEYRHKKNSEQGRVLLNAGSLVIMPENFQKLYLHRVPIAPEISQTRINLTFRTVIAPVQPVVP